MSLNKKLLASAIVGLLISGNAGAVVLGTDPARIYAEEMNAPVDLTLDAGDSVDFALGYNFSPNEVRYGRFECTSNITMANVTVTEADGTIALGAINGEGTNALFFSLTADPALAVATNTDIISVDGDNTLTDGGDVNCQFSIYDQPSQAQAGGLTGRIYTTGMAPFITRATSYQFTGTPGLATADVEAANGAYTDFVNPGAPGSHDFGAMSFGLAPVVPLFSDGTPITLAHIFNAATSVTVAGDFTAAADVTWNGASADTLTVDDATFDIGAVATAGVLTFAEDGTTAIAESDYNATLNAVTNPGFTVAAAGSVAAGQITRNGTQLQAPLAQVPGAGWISRMILTNTGNLARPFEISVMGEAGNTIGTGVTTGSVPANGTIVVELPTVLTSFTEGKQRRATLNVTVAGPNNQIQGLYQIVNANEGSISNHVMVRPGTN